MLGTGENAVMGTWHLAPFMASPPALIVVRAQRSSPKWASRQAAAKTTAALYRP
jgi:hypothetical protein